MRDDLDRLLGDVTLTTVAFAIALGWSLYQLAHGIATFVDGLMTHLSRADASEYSAALVPGGGLYWVVGRRIVALDGVLVGLVELLVVLATAVFVRSRRSTSS